MTSEELTPRGHRKLTRAEARAMAILLRRVHERRAARLKAEQQADHWTERKVCATARDPQ